MTIVIHDEPLRSLHRYRGVGEYTAGLIDALTRYQHTHRIIRSSSTQSVSEKIDIDHYTVFDLYNRTLPLFKKRKLVLTIHDLIPLKFPMRFPVGIRGLINLQYQKLALRSADAIITDSQSSKEDIVSLLGISPEKVHVVYLATGKEYRKLRNEEIIKLGLEKKYSLPAHYLLYVGDVNWNKNLEGLLRAFADFRVKKNSKLVLVGKAFEEKDLPEVRKARQYIHSNGLVKDVISLGYVPTESLVGIINRAIVLIQPSYYEGFGLPALEAMQCGIPVIAGNGGSLPEVVGDAGLLVNPYDSGDIGNALIKVEEYTSRQRQAMIERGIRQARKFSWKKTAEETIRVYEKCFDATNY